MPIPSAASEMTSLVAAGSSLQARACEPAAGDQGQPVDELDLVRTARPRVMNGSSDRGVSDSAPSG
jgi:hypothetical protein